MRKILVTGGTVFVSRYVAEYYVKKGDEVYVLNRNHHKQSDGVVLLEGDRNNLGDMLKNYDFDVILDITAYNAEDINNLINGLKSVNQYIMVSSSAVYPETLSQPFRENQPVGANKFWGAYGTNKIEAEKALLSRVPDAYILRPPYLYGQMNNVYREAFVFDCAMDNRKFYMPKAGSMKLQFFHINDLCRMIDAILEKKPVCHIFNVGNKEAVSIKDWVAMCYEAAGKELELVPVMREIEQRNYFCFYDYEYILDVSKQEKLLDNLKPLKVGIKESYEWYINNKMSVNRRNYFEYIENELA